MYELLIADYLRQIIAGSVTHVYVDTLMRRDYTLTVAPQVLHSSRLDAYVSGKLAYDVDVSDAVHVAVGTYHRYLAVSAVGGLIG